MGGIRLMCDARLSPTLEACSERVQASSTPSTPSPVARRPSRRAALARSLRRDRGGRRLERLLRLRIAGAPAARGAIREIPLDAIRGTLEPSRAAQFDGCFRPVARSARKRWERIVARRGPRRHAPADLASFAIGDRYAVLDGHHRVSVARARGAVTIDATVESR